MKAATSFSRPINKPIPRPRGHGTSRRQLPRTVSRAPRVDFGDAAARARRGRGTLGATGLRPVRTGYTVDLINSGLTPNQPRGQAGTLLNDCLEAPSIPPPTGRMPVAHLRAPLAAASAKPVHGRPDQFTPDPEPASGLRRNPPQRLPRSTIDATSPLAKCQWHPHSHPLAPSPWRKLLRLFLPTDFAICTYDYIRSLTSQYEHR
jgi:hypothetical protein